MIRNEPGMPAQFQGMSQGSVPDSGLGARVHEGSGFPSEIVGFQGGSNLVKGVPPLPLPAAVHSPLGYHSGFEPRSALVGAGLAQPQQGCGSACAPRVGASPQRIPGASLEVPGMRDPGVRPHYLEGPRYQEPSRQAPAAVSDGFQSADSRNHAGQGDGSKLGNQGHPRSTKGPYEFGFGSLGRVHLDPQGNVRPSGPVERPEEPAKYISEIPKLVQADLSVSAVVCGNWLARVKQIFQGLSPNAHEWFSAVESAATENYNKWLVADPVERLLLDPGSVVAVFDA